MTTSKKILTPSAPPGESKGVNLSIITLLTAFESDLSLPVLVCCMSLLSKKAFSLIGSRMSVVTFSGYLQYTVIFVSKTSISGWAYKKYLIESFRVIS